DLPGRALDLHVGDRRGVAPGPPRHRDAAALRNRGRGIGRRLTVPLPLGLPGGDLERVARALVRREIAQAQLDGIDAEVGSDLAQQRLAREAARELPRRAQVA